jgi:hypothetical protein
MDSGSESSVGDSNDAIRTPTSAPWPFSRSLPKKKTDLPRFSENAVKSAALFYAVAMDSWAAGVSD